MSRSAKKSRTLLAAALGIGGTLALVIGLGVLAGAGVAASSAKPVNTSPPKIKGTPKEGEKLTKDIGEWTNNPTGYDGFWMRCDQNGTGCSDIKGGNNATYTLASADVGHTIRLRVEATNADGTTSATSVPTAVVTASNPFPTNSSPPTISGTPQEGKTLSGDRGNWSGKPTDYNLYWVRCDKNGAGCSDIGGANKTTYVLTPADVGKTIRFKVGAKNAAGRTFASSVPTTVVSAASRPLPPPTTPASAAGCPGGSGAVNVASIGSPARLLIDAQQTSPSVVNRGTNQLIVRYHVSACGGRSVQGALVYATAVPFNQLTIPSERQTDGSGWAELDFRMLAGFPVSSKQQLIAIFARARKSGENILGGISTRRLFSVQVNLHG